MSRAIVQELHIYPLKSARGIPCGSIRLSATGFEWDRHWMVVRPEGTFLTQRTHPGLARIRTEIARSGLVLQADGLAPLTLTFAASGTAQPVRIFKDRCEALDQGDTAAQWLSAALGETVRLVRAVPVPARQADPHYTGPRSVPLAFPDGFPILVCNRASLDELNARLGEALPMGRFRPNLVLDGLPPFAEDRIAALEIGPVMLRLVKPCTRCVIPSHDQLTGLRGTDPLPVLRIFRFNRELRGVTFGENALIASGVGEIIERGAECRVIFKP